MLFILVLDEIRTRVASVWPALAAPRGCYEADAGGQGGPRRVARGLVGPGNRRALAMLSPFHDWFYGKRARWGIAWPVRLKSDT